MSARRVLLAATLTLLFAADAQAINYAYVEPVWTKPVTAGTNTWWWYQGNDYAKANSEVAYCYRRRQGPRPGTQNVPDNNWLVPAGGAWPGNPTNGNLPSSGCYTPPKNAQGAYVIRANAWQLPSMTPGLPYTFCSAEWAVTAGTWSKTTIPEQCQTTTIDTAVPTTTVTINNGAAWTRSLRAEVRFGYSDATGQFWPATFACYGIGSQCTPPATRTDACSNYPAAPNYSCYYDHTAQPDGTTIHHCGRVGDSAIPDILPSPAPPQPSTNAPPYATNATFAPSPGLSQHNLSGAVCASIRLDRTAPTFAANTPTTAVAGQATQFTVTDAHAGVNGSPTWTIDGATKSGTTVSHTFSGTGAKSLSVPVTDNAGNSTTLTRTIMVSAAPAPAVGLSPESMAFHTDDGSAGGLQTLTITHTGSATLNITGIAFGAGTASEFSRPGGDPGTCTNATALAAGNACTVKLRYSPANATPAGTTHTGTLQITSNAAGSPTSVPLNGTTTNSLSTPPEVSPNPLAFGVQAVDTSSTKTVTFTNAGDQGMTANLTSVVLSGNAAFSRTGGTCTNGQVIAGGASCTVIIGYAPTTIGSKTATLTFSHNLNGAGTNTVTITGTTPDAGNDGGESDASSGTENLDGNGTQSGGGEALSAAAADAPFSDLKGGVLLSAMSDALLLKAAGGGKVMKESVGTLELKAASRFVLKKVSTSLPVGLKASAKGTVALMLKKGSKTLAKGSVKLLKAGRYAFALSLPKQVRTGRHKLTGTFTPSAGKGAAKTLKITFMPAPPKKGSRALAIW